jgi:hypothetical protein
VFYNWNYPKPEDQLAFIIRHARGWAKSITQEPEIWEAKIDELERLSKDNGTAVARLIELLWTYARAKKEAVYLTLRISLQRGCDPDSKNRPPLPLLDEIVLIAHYALVSRGLEATEALLSAYKRASSGSLERSCILEVLADIGDPATKTFFFQELSEDEFVAQAKTEWADMEEALAPLKQGTYDEAKIEEGAKHWLEQIRIRYQRARAYREKDT